jgi:DNA invertase Pin-like site-specific DNA recombinase
VDEAPLGGPDLRGAGCQAIFEERASGGSRSRVELARCLERIGPNDNGPDLRKTTV